MRPKTRKDREYLKWWNSIAFEYESKELSPLSPKVKNPVFGFIEGLNSNDYQKVADLGCGTGVFLGFLSLHFKEVWGIDWSRNMLHIAKKKNRDLQNVHLKKLDIRNLRTFYGYFDAVFSINSIIASDISVDQEIVKEIHKVLRVNGLFVAIFPSFDAVMYQRRLTYTSHIKRGLNWEEALQKTDEQFVKRNKMNFTKGTYADDGIHEQKFFTENEIHSLLQNSGFRSIITEKVLYPWLLSKKHGYGYFPGEPEIWDWFCVARK